MTARPQRRDDRRSPKLIRDVEIEQLQGQVTIAKLLARRFWNALKVRPGFRVDEEALFDCETLRVVDPVYDAAEAIWERHRVLVEPCRRVFDSQEQNYLGVWPDGEKRNLTEDQIMMMAGMDPLTAADRDHSNIPELPF